MTGGTDPPIIAAADAVAAKAEADADTERQNEAEAKRHAAASKEHLADGYWQTRWQAEQRAAAAKRLAVALRDAQTEITK